MASEGGGQFKSSPGGHLRRFLQNVLWHDLHPFIYLQTMLYMLSSKSIKFFFELKGTGIIELGLDFKIAKKDLTC